MPARGDAKGEGAEVSASNWSFIEKRCPGAHAAWSRDVGLPENSFTFGVTGGDRAYPLRAVANTRDWSSVPAEERRRFEYLHTEKTWRQTHP